MSMRNDNDTADFEDDKVVIDISEPLLDLISNETKKTGLRPTYKEMSMAIYEKTGVKISHTSLNNYAQGKNVNSLSAKNLLALADYFDCSFEFLLGRSLNRKRKNVDLGKRFGLNDFAIEMLENLYQRRPIDIYGNTIENSSTDALNDLLSTAEFVYILDKITELKHFLLIQKERKMKINSGEPKRKRTLKTKFTYDPLSGNHFSMNMEDETFADILKFDEKLKELYGDNALVVDESSYVAMSQLHIYNLLNKMIDIIVRDAPMHETLKKIDKKMPRQ